MRLLDYLAARGETQAAFARRSGLDKMTVGAVCRGGGARVGTAFAIIEASKAEPAPDGGTVTLEDLLPTGREAAEDRAGGDRASPEVADSRSAG